MCGGMRIFSHIGPDTIHRAGQALTPAKQAGEQFFVVHGIPAKRYELDTAGRAVGAGFIEEFLDHAARVGLYSYLVKDYNPSAPTAYPWDKNPMGKRDPFIEGLRIILAAKPDLKPAPLAEAADLDNSTLRKALAGTIKSLTVEKAEKIARAAGYDLSTVIALGENSRGAEIVDLALAIHQAPEKVRQDLDGYLQVKLAQAGTGDPKAPSPSAIVAP